MNDKGYGYWQAKYATESHRRAPDKEYQPRQRVSYSPSDPVFQNYTLIEDDSSQWGWRLYSNYREKEKIISLNINKKTGYQRVTTTLNIGGKPIIFTLAQLIWLMDLHRDIPAGYVIDHIDNNSQNNTKENLQILTIRENLLKNSSEKYKQHILKMEKRLDSLYDNIIKVSKQLSEIPTYRYKETQKHMNTRLRLEKLKAARESLLIKYNSELDFQSKISKEDNKDDRI